MIATAENIRGEIKSLKKNTPTYFPISKRRAIWNYTSELRVECDMDFIVKTISNTVTGDKKMVRVTRTK